MHKGTIGTGLAAHSSSSWLAFNTIQSRTESVGTLTIATWDVVGPARPHMSCPWTCDFYLGQADPSVSCMDAIEASGANSIGCMGPWKAGKNP